MKVIVVSKKSHYTFKYLTFLFAFVAVGSLSYNIKVLTDIDTYKSAYHSTVDRLAGLRNELSQTQRERDTLIKKVEAKKIAAVAASREAECLAKNVYFEAGGESTTGKIAVANVVVNRLKHPNFPNTVCGVVYQGANTGKTNCQFSWACDGVDKAIKYSSRAWQDSKAIAVRVLAGKKQDVTRGALYFHNHTVSPSWADTNRLTASIGGHSFYR